MKRTIEELNQKRQKKEKDFLDKLTSLKEKHQKYFDSGYIQTIGEMLSDLEKAIAAYSPQKTGETKHLFSKTDERESFQSNINQSMVSLFRESRKVWEQNLKQAKELFSCLVELAELNSGLMDAKDKEWDALGSNHVGIIFKSMEWRIDKLAAGYEDATLLMKKFLHLKENLNALLETLEKKALPSPAQIREISQPLDDFLYAGFENRYRGSEDSVKKQQEIYLTYFQPGKKVLDLGCGRGEFIDLLQQKGVEAEGIDMNDQMIEICRDRDLNCRKASILEVLTECQDNSLGGIFSSQVVEHLDPAYVKRMVELAYFKLSPDSSLVLETINPASVFSLVQIYFLDISHQQPVHPLALKFLMESAGFKDVEIKYSSLPEAEQLQTVPASDEYATILNQNIDKLNKLLYSPTNYAAIGRK